MFRIMKMRWFAPAACVPTLLLISACGSLLTRANDSTATPQPGASVKVPLGEVSKVFVLNYSVMNPEKPFTDAVLILFENGSYRIASPGEDHYGSYVVAKTDPVLDISFISWPSKDWAINGASNVAMHALTFNGDETFTQILTEPDGAISEQAGRWKEHKPLTGVAPNSSWEDLSRLADKQ